MTAFVEKHRKTIFRVIVAAAFCAIFAYNLLTPYMSDDYAYLLDVREADGLFDLIRQQYGEYLSNSGRVIGQFNVRLSLSLGKPVFNVINSVMFTALLLFMYANIKRKKGVVKMKERLIKRLHEIILEIAKADDRQLDKIGVELADIEKKLLGYVPEKKHTNGN